MLDNRSPKEISKIINILKKLHLRDKVKIEASGGINYANIQSYARTGVDMISVGKITSSVQGLDLSLEVNWLQAFVQLQVVLFEQYFLEP